MHKEPVDFYFPATDRVEYARLETNGGRTLHLANITPGNPEGEALPEAELSVLAVHSLGFLSDVSVQMVLPEQIAVDEQFLIRPVPDAELSKKAARFVSTYNAGSGNVIAGIRLADRDSLEARIVDLATRHNRAELAATAAATGMTLAAAALWHFRKR